MFLFLINLAIAHEPNIFAEWPKDPKVNICDENVNKEMVLEALEYWKEKGHSVEKVYIRKNCAYEEGAIYIRFAPEKVKKYQYANTFSKWNINSRVYKRAIINLSESSISKKDTYIHEFGHAFGYVHTDDQEHIMHGSEGPFDHLSYKKVVKK